MSLVTLFSAARAETGCLIVVPLYDLNRSGIVGGSNS